MCKSRGEIIADVAASHMKIPSLFCHGIYQMRNRPVTSNFEKQYILPRKEGSKIHVDHSKTVKVNAYTLFLLRIAYNEIFLVDSDTIC